MVMEIERLTARFGTVPPPWIVAPDEHPYSAYWRMGGGESHIMVWGAWWDTQALDEAARITYFRQFPPQPRWLDWMVEAIWDLPFPDGEEDDGLLDRTPYFAQAEALGFGSHQDYERDLEDPRP
ncbi:hypothetical protein LAJ19_15000 (plasmid) [Deinococcus taeanensis]|uniref:hypothetical protein n=1 Tax=Deinococcus taeanensis TaxID=2737050 RepID=UPI001CDC0A2C|nr:hypothetical protein [Deinococcus taeanensis]UBV44113.1 hypothetical protein LAJ19_15000 [Deinococcus taeanensis]